MKIRNRFLMSLVRRVQNSSMGSGAKSRSTDIYFVVSLVSAAIVAFLLVGWFAFAPISEILGSIPDDTCFYFKIAENMVHGRGLTFDGIHLTNGVQPLWQLFCAGVSWMVGGVPETTLRVTLILQVLMLLAGWFMFERMLRKTLSELSRLLGCWLFLLFILISCTNGMESPLFLACLTVLGWAWVQMNVTSEPGAGVPVIFGMVLGITMLARLDSVFLGGALCVALLFDGIRRHEARKTILLRIVWVVLAASVIVLPYLIYNQLVFGAIMPISGSLKSGFPHPSISLARILSFGKQPLLFALLAFAHLLTAPWILRRQCQNGGNNVQLFALACASAVVIHFIHEALFMKWASSNSHFTLYVFYAVILAVTLWDAIMRRLGDPMLRRIPGFAVWFLALLAVGVIVWRGSAVRRPHGGNMVWHRIVYDAAIWARENTPPDARFGMKDTGIFALFSRRDVVSLDGLVNNSEFQTVLRDKRLNTYFRENRVSYLVQHAFYSVSDPTPAGASWETYQTVSMRYFSHRYDAWSDPVILRREAEVYRSERYEDEGRETILALWRISAE